jgi:hypothetical protein
MWSGFEGNKKSRETRKGSRKNRRATPNAAAGLKPNHPRESSNIQASRPKLTADHLVFGFGDSLVLGVWDLGI